MIIQINNSDQIIAQDIYSLFQRGYQVEATVIGVEDFPPLQRSLKQIATASTRFHGLLRDEQLVSVIESGVENQVLVIHSVVVDPAYFRRGAASQLLKFVLSSSEYSEATVETAAVNHAAITLYQKHGFAIDNHFTPSHGIEKVAMSLSINTV